MDMNQDELNVILDNHRKWFQSRNGCRAHLTAVNLNHADLSRAHLIAAYLNGADLSHSDLRGANLSRSDLRAANLIGAKLNGAELNGAEMLGVNLSSADLSNTDLTQASLINASLNYANLSNANLSNANLSGANLSNSNLNNTNLSRVNLNGANLKDANLSCANLNGANLKDANLNYADLRNADLNDASINMTSFGNTNLSEATIDKCKHFGPSILDFNTLQISGMLPLSFLRGCGLPDAYIDYLPSLLHKPIQFYHCFISFSNKDNGFANKLYSDLQGKGVRCWFAPQDLKIGDPVRDIIEAQIRVKDKLLVILSKNSIDSDWVEHEVDIALEEEKQQQKSILFPIRIDESIMQTKFGWIKKIRQAEKSTGRHIGDFTQWKEYNPYTLALERLLRDLKLKI